MGIIMTREGQEAVEGGLQQGAAVVLEVEELLGAVGGAERPEALALATGHDHGAELGQACSDIMTARGGRQKPRVV